MAGKNREGVYWMDVGANGTTIVYADDGEGAVQTTRTDSLMENVPGGFIYGVTLLKHATGEDLVITLPNTSTITEFAGPSADATEDILRVYPGGGVQFTNGQFSAKVLTGNTARYRIWFTFFPKSSG